MEGKHGVVSTNSFGTSASTIASKGKMNNNDNGGRSLCNKAQGVSYLYISMSLLFFFASTSSAVTKLKIIVVKEGV